ncbi:glucose and ribitol dehydrogenase isoform X1 [Physcomitrium patens]|uniref:glucose and ribitol dehydrogenase isoform X1 n=1 Tax=Physcomitrium patens TaxID=3218 RepID=UPI000D15728D|nr:glucose and ribitol dehydrogenase-like isoform X3 [Physcomitrium patens]XP_024376056.1 glucose and ribitol dehydrogenase-like isoform X3 [Physcomitrium patens]|eukprot:XP_024376055.1 glucose and ribitol dehydrogenase-like isoform X3 [Physcomitrella patens]
MMESIIRFEPDKMSRMVEDPSPNIPAQTQKHHPGVEAEIQGPKPQYYSDKYVPAGKLEGKVAIVTGGDSGIGRSVSVLFAAEGAEAVVIVYKAPEEDIDGEHTVKDIERVSLGKCKARVIRTDLGHDDNCKLTIDAVVKEFGRIDVLVNNASEQFYKESIEEIEPEQLERTFRSNIFSMFYMTRHAVKHMKEGACIINTTSITAYQGAPMLLDYSATKGAILAFTRGLALQLVKRGIRVNGVAPGPIWTPFIPASFPAEQTEGAKWGTSTVPMARAGQPFECGTAYVFLASEDSSYYTGQVLHPNGGAVVNA